MQHDFMVFQIYNKNLFLQLQIAI